MNITLAAAALVTIAATANAQAAGPRQTFIIRKGPDTVAVEHFSRDAGLLTGDITQSTGLKTEYVLTLRPDNTVEHADVTRKTKAGGVATMSIDFSGKTVSATIAAGGQSEKDDLSSDNFAAPFLAVSFALSEQIVRASHLTAGQSVKWTAVRLGAGDTATVTIARFHADSVSLTMADVAVKLALNAKGDVIGGSHSIQPWTVERKP